MTRQAGGAVSRAGSQEHVHADLDGLDVAEAGADSDFERNCSGEATSSCKFESFLQPQISISNVAVASGGKVLASWNKAIVCGVRINLAHDLATSEETHKCCLAEST